MSFLKKSSPLLVIIGPSAAGKSTVISELVDDGVIEVTPTWSTRPKRPDETEGTLEHVFCDEETFENAKSEGKFLETDRLFGLPYQYGLPKIQVPKKGRIPLIMLRVMVLKPLYKYYDNPVIYQIEAPKESIKERLEQRGKAGIPTGTRLSDYDLEINKGREVAKRYFLNTDLKETVAAIKAAIYEDFPSGS